LVTNKEAIETIKANYPNEQYAMLREALDIAMALLKAQEPKLVPDIAEAMLGYRPKVKVGHCPSCGVLMSETDKFCRKCGQAVKWNDD